MKAANKIFAGIVGAVLLSAAPGCFTGVESTPAIKTSEVRRLRAATATPEQHFLADVQPLPPSRWQAGRRLFVANDRIALIFNSGDDAAGLAGHTIAFETFMPARTLTGDDATEAIFRADDGRLLHYRIPALDAMRLDTLSRLDIPFTVDLSLIARADSAMRGKRYWINTPAWYDGGASRAAVAGLRHIEVTVDSVVPGDENFPAAVYFTPVDGELRARTIPQGGTRMVLMSVGNGLTATRNFDVLFSFTDPRRRYPDIKDDVWELIISSRIRQGMTRDECRLALGAPPQLERVPTHAGMQERWRYSDGVYLIFDDGYLTRYRQ